MLPISNVDGRGGENIYDDLGKKGESEHIDEKKEAQRRRGGRGIQEEPTVQRLPGMGETRLSRFKTKASISADGRSRKGGPHAVLPPSRREELRNQRGLLDSSLRCEDMWRRLREEVLRRFEGEGRTHSRLAGRGEQGREPRAGAAELNGPKGEGKAKTEGSQ